MEAIFSSILVFLFLLLPPILTLCNLLNLFRKAPWQETLIDRLTFLLGPLFMGLLWWFWSAPDWDQPVYMNWEPYLHTPLASWHLPTVLALQPGPSSASGPCTSSGSVFLRSPRSFASQGWRSAQSCLSCFSSSSPPIS